MSARIVYLCFPGGQPQGGVKMVLRHVETLRELGFDAVCQIGSDNQLGSWLEHTAPVLVAQPLRPDDILVLPEDAVGVLRQLAPIPFRKVIFVQGQLNMAALSLDALDTFPADDPPTVMTVGGLAAATIRRLLPGWPVEVVPCFADERRFAPGAKHGGAIVLDPKKRQAEPRMIRAMFSRLYRHE